MSAAADMQSVLTFARRNDVDLVILSDELEDANGADVCAVLEGLPGHAPLLYVGESLVPGADAVAPPDAPARILEQALAMLESAELMETLGNVQEDAKDTKPSKPAKGNGPTKGAKSGAKAAPAAAKRDTELVEALLRKVRESDYFEILGVPADASDDEIRDAYSSIHAMLAAAGVPRAQLEEAQATLDEALDVLTEPALRAAYTRNRP